MIREKVANKRYKDTVFRMLFSDKVRTYQKEMSLDEAVDRAVNECIAEGILADFLRANKAEVMNMSIYEYDEELHIKTMMDIGREEGREEGRQEGRQEGRLEGIRGTVVALKSMGCDDETIIQKLIDVYDISTEVAEAIVKG